MPVISSRDLSLLLLPAGLSFFACLLAYPVYIGWLKRKQIQQYIRQEGPQSHAAKAKTPTMGGLCFIGGTLASALATWCLSWQWSQASGGAAAWVAPLSVGTICGLLGFADDYGKITSRSNQGISARSRLAVEFGLGFLLSLALFFFKLPYDQLLLSADVSASDPAHSVLQLQGASALVYLALVVPMCVAATANAVNLHDGMDGLAGGTAIQVFATIAFMCWLSGNFPCAAVSAACAGALAAFLLFNRHPARVFMGDTGSLFLGGLMAAVVVTAGLTIWFIPLALVYVIETVSVMAQVVYFKLTKPYNPDPPVNPAREIWTRLTKRLPGEGKRLLRMAPIHHHFEAVAAEKGFKEWEVVICFWLVQAILCVVVLACFV